MMSTGKDFGGRTGRSKLKPHTSVKMRTCVETHSSTFSSFGSLSEVQLSEYAMWRLVPQGEDADCCTLGAGGAAAFAAAAFSIFSLSSEAMVPRLR
ncbi:hypothetical protein R1flu_025319 [Riccia fluitans]|uniref:Uncharacterized protein n=1 Tax=Riccia fluitans TaxID=41844 RepID=A0ABD1XXE2_9MARC